MHACIYLVTTLLMVSSLVIPILGLQSPQSIQSYGTISYQAGLLYGVCGWPWTLTERDFQEAKNLGVKYLRMDFVWIEFEEYRDAPFNFAKYDQIVGWAKENGIQIIPLLGHVPYWFNNATEWDIPTGTDFNDLVTRFGQFVHKVVDHYKADIQYFEIWNEPNLPLYWNDLESTLYVYDQWHTFNSEKAVQKYVTLLKEAYTQAKSANPNCVVISAGISNYSPYLQEMYSYGVKGYFDVFGSHPYFWHGPTKNYDPDYVDESPDRFPNIQKMRDVMVANGDGAKKILITELGVDGESGPEGPTTEAIQARALTRVFEKTQQEFPYVEGIMWFHLRTDMGNYGLLREDYTQRQMYYAYEQLISTHST